MAGKLRDKLRKGGKLKKRLVKLTLRRRMWEAAMGKTYPPKGYYRPGSMNPNK